MSIFTSGRLSFTGGPKTRKMRVLRASAEGRTDRGQGVLLSGFVATPETHLAWQAVRRLAAALKSGRTPRVDNPLVLHGPPGSGKSHLAVGLVAAVTADSPSRTARVVAAADFATETPDEALACDLLIVEDLQHLPARA